MDDERTFHEEGSGITLLGEGNTFVANEKKNSDSAAARSRWKILRNVLMKKSTASRSHFSIHAFQGFSLFSPPNLLDDSFVVSLLGKLTRLTSPGTEWTIGSIFRELQVRVPAISALLNHQGSACSSRIVTDFSLSPPVSSDLFGDLQLTIDYSCPSCEIGVHGCDMVSPRTVRVLIQIDSEYCVRRYQVGSNSSSILARERIEKKVGLHELSSHQLHNGVGNTGNVCVWDAERTLAWVMLQEIDRHEQRVETVTEVGAGMVGLGALVLAAHQFPRSRVYLTDGHNACVRNNEINICLTRAAAENSLQPYLNRVESRHVLWSASSRSNLSLSLIPPPADWVLVSDCTHFEDQHGKLLWTLLECTKAGGCIWMCQPARALSFSRFLNAIEALNEGSLQALILVQERLYTDIEQQHLLSLKTHTSYKSDIQKPLVFVLIKLRQANELDRTNLLIHMKCRSDSAPQNIS